MSGFSRNLSILTAVALVSIDLLAGTAPAEATNTPQPILLETTQYNDLDDVEDMAFLAIRSQRKPLTKAGTGPYTMTHTNPNPALSYQYLTDANYGVSSGSGRHSTCNVTTSLTDTRGCLAQLWESDLRPDDRITRTSIIPSGGLSATLTIQGDIVDKPSGSAQADPDNTKDQLVTFGTAFGPQVWSAPFSANAGSAVSYRWNAAGSDDDYELYGFLVSVGAQSGCSANTSYGGISQAEKEASHKILTYSRGKDTGGFLQASGVIETSGCYRMRFVNGSYDASGGLVIGSTMLISDLRYGTPQTITATQLPDVLIDASNPQSAQLSATSDAQGATLVYTSLSPSSVCTINSVGLVTIPAGATGRCTIKIDSGEVGPFVAAAPVYTSFSILASATAPAYLGGALIAGSINVLCSALTIEEGTWGTGASPVTSTTYQWLRDGSPIAGETSTSLSVSEQVIGSTVSFVVTKSNAIGTTTAVSNELFIADARLADLTTSGTGITFDSCATSYAITSETPSFTVTATATQSHTALTVGGAAATSGQVSGPFTLNPGVNIVNVIVSTGQVSRTVVLSVTWNPPADSNDNELNLPEIRYPEPSVRLVIGSYAVLTPESLAGEVETWAIDLDLPEGLIFDSSTGVISGTPKVPGGPVTFTISGTNADGTATTTLQIEVLAFVRSDGPLIESINPRTLFVDEAATITLTGKRLQLLETVSLDGITITITVVSKTVATFDSPGLTAGRKNLVFATDGHGDLVLFDGLNVVAKPAAPATEAPVVVIPTESPEVTPTESPVVTPPTASPEPGDGSEPGFRVVKRTISGFAPGSPVLTDAMKALIAQRYSELGNPASVTCIGFTQGPTALAVDLQLSVDRATVACDYLKTLNPNIQVLRVEGKQEVPVGNSIRRVELYFLVPITR